LAPEGRPTVDGVREDVHQWSVPDPIQTAVAITVPIVGPVLTWRLGDERVPQAITAVSVVVAIVAFVWRLKTKNRFATAVMVSCFVVTATSWTTSVFANPDPDDPGGTQEPGGGGPTTTQTGDRPPRDADTSLCAEPAAVANSLFLYETSGAPSKIVIEQDGRAVWDVDGSAFAAAGSRLVYVDPALPSRVIVEEIATHEWLATTVLDGRVTDTTISQDGEVVVLVENRSGDTRLVLWRPSTEEREVLFDPRADVSAPSLSPAGDRIAWVQGGSSSGEVLVAELPALATRTVVESGGDPAWSPDGHSIVYTTRRSGEGTAVYATAADGGEPLKLTNPVQADDSDPVVLPSCDGVAFARAKDDSVDLWQRDLGSDSDTVLRELTGAQSRPAFATE
jgi:dipeptidyl aminopeptidase/acylaminoacyl peptidase